MSNQWTFTKELYRYDRGDRRDYLDDYDYGGRYVPNWTFTFHNDFAQTLQGALSERIPRDCPSTIRLCACCSVLVDPVITQVRSEARLSEIRAASRNCVLCKLLVQVAERFHNDADPNPMLVRVGPTLEIGQEGSRILRLCSNIESPPVYREDVPVSFPVLPEPESSARFALLRGWLEWCDTTHDCNQRNAGSQGPSPTRLIYVGHADPQVLRLYLPKENEGLKYIALSHRWGKHPPTEIDPQFCTTDDNVDARKNGFRMSELPKTFQDAVRVTRELGIKYLWIDSLCIIQWNAEDWKREADGMEDVFASAYCTIAATSAVDSNAGFLARNRSTEYMRVQDAAGNQVCVCTHMDNFEDDVEQAELNKRAWVMQERVLAKRTIHFSANQTYWECGKGVYCENLTMMESSPRRSYFLLDPSFPNRLLESGIRRTIEFIHFLFEDYSSRDLTKDTDRRVAVSGLEARIAGALQCKSRHGIFQKHLHRNLLWQASNRKMERIAYDNDQQVPSWSWMACSGGIRFMEVKIGLVSWVDALAFDDERDCALIADVGKFRNCTIKPGDNHSTILDISANRAGWMRYDVMGVKESTENYCVVIGRKTKDADEDQYYVLAVVPTGEDGEYMRVGIGVVRAGCVERLRADVRIV